jgi:hypothetical protein
MGKIYNKIVIDIATGKVEEEDSYEYSGPVARCWAAAAPYIAMGAATLLGAMTQDDGDSKSGGRPMYTMQNIPSDIQERLLGQIRSMPTGMNVNFGGQTFPGMYGPQMRALNTLYSPHGAIPNQPVQPSALSAGMIASAPLMWRAANQVQQQQPMYYPSSGYGYNDPSTWGGADYLGG